MEDKKLKEEFIKYFGEETCNQEEILAKLRKVSVDICNRWLGIEPIPLLFSDDIGTDEARLDITEQVIWLNVKNQNNYIDLLESVIHELEHLYQIYYVCNFDTPKAKRWKSEIINYIGGENKFRNLMQEIEIDAMAFAQIVLNDDYGIYYKHQDPTIQEVIENYMKSGKILSDD